MDKPASDTLTHVYGLAGLVTGLISLVLVFKSGTPLAEYAVLASGWVVAILFALILTRMIAYTRSDSSALASLRAKVADLQRTLDQREAVLEYLASLQLTKQAKPRVGR